MPEKLFTLLSGVFAHLKVHCIVFGETFNRLVKNREKTIRQFFNLCNYHNVGVRNHLFVPPSALYGILKAQNPNSRIKHAAIFNKFEVYNLLKRYFVSERQVSLDLCVASCDFLK